MLITKEHETENHDKFPKGFFRWILGLIVGGVSSIIGIGGGTLSVPILSIFKYPIRRAVGTAAAIGLLISIPGAVGAFLSGLNKPNLPPFSFGYVNLMAFIILLPIPGFLARLVTNMAQTISLKILT